MPEWCRLHIQMRLYRITRRHIGRQPAAEKDDRDEQSKQKTFHEVILSGSPLPRNHRFRRSAILTLVAAPSRYLTPLEINQQNRPNNLCSSVYMGTETRKLSMTVHILNDRVAR